MTKPTHMISPFQQGNWNRRDERRLERITATLPSWAQPGRGRDVSPAEGLLLHQSLDALVVGRKLAVLHHVQVHHTLIRQ
jgi:hypothetical protein